MLIKEYLIKNEINAVPTEYVSKHSLVVAALYLNIKSVVEIS